MSHRPHRRSPLITVIAALLAPLVAGACTAGAREPTHIPESSRHQEHTVNLATRPTMEAMLDRYHAFERDLIARLDSSFGKRAWQLPGGDRLLRSGCSEEDDPSGQGEHVVLPARDFQGAYPANDRDRVRELVIAVGKEHGFTNDMVHLDNSVALMLAGRDQYGAVYHFGDGDYTGFYITTGCHRWQHPPVSDEQP